MIGKQHGNKCSEIKFYLYTAAENKLKQTEIKDFLGNPVKVGDKVIYVTSGSRGLNVGEVAKINNKSVTLKSGLIRESSYIYLMK